MSENHEVEYLSGVVRELCMALDEVRLCCGNSIGHEAEDEERLARAEFLAAEALSRNGKLVGNFRSADYWLEVAKLRAESEKKRMDKLKREEDGHGR